jgi:predicted N-acetyltransferase YhbS
VTDLYDENASIEGPRAVRPDELEALRRLTDVVFRPLMPEQYPQLFNVPNCENLRVCFHGDRCVSHVGMVHRGASILGCQIKVCCIGAVATDPDYRGKGLASLCFHDAVRKADEDGVDVMLVSGGRGLYTTNGCQHAGLHYKAVIDAAQDGMGCGDIVVSEALPADMPEIQECYRAEPVRFTRLQADYDFFAQSGWAMNAPSRFLVLRSATSELLGYVVLRAPEPGKASTLSEFGGDRSAVARAVPVIIDRYQLSGVNFQVQGFDMAMLARCREAGWALSLVSASGTIKIINVSRLMQKLTPLFSERADPETALRLKAEERGTDCVFDLDGDKAVISRDDTVRLIFGIHEHYDKILENQSGACATLLRKILPVPALWYGINYV